MKTNAYNILWADDEVDALIDRYEERFNDNDIAIVEWAHDGKELEERLSTSVYKIDAVIIDANFNYTKIVPGNELNERNISGLDYAHSLYAHKFNRSIPFFLFTQRTDEMLHNKLDERPEFNDDFIRHWNWFRKNDDDELAELFDSIKKEVNNRNSDSFRIRNKYCKEFEAAKNIEDAERYLMTGLLYLYEDDSWKNVQDYFNPARKIVERMMAKCMELNILPPDTTLNNASRYFSNTSNDNHIRLKEEIMPRALAESFFYFLKITQDGSHDENDMTLGVDKYVRESKNINLYRTILYIVMDLLVWFDKVYKKYENNQEPLWEEHFEYEGTACYNPTLKCFYTGQYEFAKGVQLQDGAKVRVYESTNNWGYHKSIYPRLVKEKDFKILK